MGTLYEINDGILDCIDFETGEILDEERLEKLNMDRKIKIRNIACLIKNLRAEAKACEEEEKIFCQRKVTARNKAERLSQYLSANISGEKYSEKEFVIGWRKSQQVYIADDANIPDAFMIPTPYKIDKMGLKYALLHGETFDGISLVEKNNIQIK